jgi:hypothetical protein
MLSTDAAQLALRLRLEPVNIIQRMRFAYDQGAGAVLRSVRFDRCPFTFPGATALAEACGIAWKAGWQGQPFPNWSEQTLAEVGMTTYLQVMREGQHAKPRWTDRAISIPDNDVETPVNSHTSPIPATSPTTDRPS